MYIRMVPAFLKERDGRPEIVPDSVPLREQDGLPGIVPGSVLLTEQGGLPATEEREELTATGTNGEARADR